MTNEYGFEIPLVSEEECKLQERIEELEEQLEIEKKLNEEIKVRFVKCNTCTDEMKSKCLMFSENLCEGDRCEELVDLIDLINKSDLQRENAELKDKNKALEQYADLADAKVDEVKSKLTKAKGLLNEYMRISKASDEDFEHDYSELIGETEQFLKEIE